MKPRVVFDCMVFLQGAGRPTSPARVCFRLVDEDRITLCLSEQVLSESRDVLTRPKTLRKFPLLSAEWVQTFLQNAAAKAVLFDAVPQVFTLARDPKDEPYVNLAIASHAHYLVSRDLDLLDLMKDPEFRQRFPNLVILDPPAFLEAVRLQEEGEKTTTPGAEPSVERPSEEKANAARPDEQRGEPDA
jgi:putative PIN family toxin of toxin-antitoxin system